MDSWNYEEKQGLAHTEFKVAVLFCGKISASAFNLTASDSPMQGHLIPHETGKIADHTGADKFLEVSELTALPDYIHCIWISNSLRALSERGPCLREFSKTINEVLTLSNWAAENTQRIIETAFAAIGIESDFCD